MSNLFKGWRRKVGVATLIFACATLGMWLRSRLVEDNVIWMGSTAAHLLNSKDGSASWTAYTRSSYFVPTERLWWSSTPLTDDPDHGWWQAKDECGTLRESQFLGFCFGTAFKLDILERADYWLIPYWSVTVPLTLLSAWLILWPGKRMTRQVSPE